jgi:hypothetical protein
VAYTSAIAPTTKTRFPAHINRVVSLSRTADAFMGVCDGNAYNSANENTNAVSNSYLYVLGTPTTATLTSPTLKTSGWKVKTTDFTVLPPTTDTLVSIDPAKLVLAAPTLSFTLDYYMGRPTLIYPLEKYIPHYATAANSVNAAH